MGKGLGWGQFGAGASPRQPCDCRGCRCSAPPAAPHLLPSHPTTTNLYGSLPLLFTTRLHHGSGRGAGDVGQSSANQRSKQRQAVKQRQAATVPSARPPAAPCALATPARPPDDSGCTARWPCPMLRRHSLEAALVLRCKVRAHHLGMAVDHLRPAGGGGQLREGPGPSCPERNSSPLPPALPL